MCGIAGKLYFDPTRIVGKVSFKKMTDSIVHRGPDDEGHLIIDNIGMGFRRLSIIDLNLESNHFQIMIKQFGLLFNGEIYNYKGLRKDLEKKKYKFKTNSDTEVIIYMYQNLDMSVLIIFEECLLL